MAGLLPRPEQGKAEGQTVHVGFEIIQKHKPLYFQSTGTLKDNFLEQSLSHSRLPDALMFPDGTTRRTSWLVDSSWSDMTELDERPNFHGIVASFEQQPPDRNLPFASAEPENAAPPAV